MGEPVSASSLTVDVAAKLRAAANHPSFPTLSARVPSAITPIVINLIFVAVIFSIMAPALEWRASLGLKPNAEWASLLVVALAAVGLFTAWRTVRLLSTKTVGEPMVVVAPQEGRSNRLSMTVIDAKGTVRRFARTNRPTRAEGEVVFVWFRADVLLDDEPLSIVETKA